METSRAMSCFELGAQFLLEAWSQALMPPALPSERPVRIWWVSE